MQAITFDFWNTLFVGVFATDLRVRHIKQVLEGEGLVSFSKERIEQAIGVAWREWDRVWQQQQFTFGAPRWVELVLEDLGVSLAAPLQEALAHTMTASGMDVRPPLIDGVADVLPRLAPRYKLALICDTGITPGRVLSQWMESNGILQYFSHLTFSDELGVSKPHPRAFLCTLESLGVSPQAAVHIGDNPRTDVAGAQGVGMRAVRFIGPYHWSEDEIRADAVIARYDELEPLLEQW
jgi:FMN phosphatase YigB (HAD superfamily)